MTTNGTQEEPTTIRKNANATEQLLLEAHNVLNDLLGAEPSVSEVSKKELTGSVEQAEYTCKNNVALAANLLSRLADLRNRI